MLAMQAEQLRHLAPQDICCMMQGHQGSDGAHVCAGGGSMDGESDLVLGLAASALSGLSSAYAGAAGLSSATSC